MNCRCMSQKKVDLEADVARLSWNSRLMKRRNNDPELRVRLPVAPSGPELRERLPTCEG